MPQSVPTPLRLHGKLARDLGLKIVSGALEAGEALETELVASERHRVSRAAYREAVRILAAKGLVVEPTQGRNARDATR